MLVVDFDKYSDKYTDMILPITLLGLWIYHAENISQKQQHGRPFISTVDWCNS